MKFRTIAFGMSLMPFGSGIVNAADFEEKAQVISSTPIVQLISQQVCQPQTIVNSPPQSQGIVGGLLGGVAGGLLGAQAGHGGGKTAATLVGAGSGAIVGNQIAILSSVTSTQTGHTCSSVLRDVVIGYSVVYRYNSRDVITSLPYDPGSFVKVGVGVIDERSVADPGKDGAMAISPPPPPGY